jgi:hypothetical protein
MRRTLLAVLLGMIFAPLAWGQDCRWCGMFIEPGKKVIWGKHAFCSEDCRQQWYLDRLRCKICNERVEPKSNRSTYSDGVHVYTTISQPTWDGYCESCRQGIKDGMIDPVKDRYVAPKNENRLDDQDRGEKRAESPTANTDKATRKGRNYLTLALGLGVGALFLVAKMLR